LLLLLFHAVRGMYLHAGRHVANAGVASATGGGSPTLGVKRSENGKGGAQRRAAQAEQSAARKPGETRCAREGWNPLVLFTGGVAGAGRPR
jgi:hypothetical protein